MDEIVPYWFEYGADLFGLLFKGEILAGKRLLPTDKVAAPPKLGFASGAKYISGVRTIPPDVVDMSIVELSAHFEKRGRRLEIGRDPECHLVLDHPTVSSKHASIEFEAHNTRWITDFRSEFGTFVNSQPLPPHIKTNLNLNDSVGIGAYKWYLRDWSWAYQSLNTRLRRPAQDEGFVRLILRYLDGRLVKRVAKDYRISGDRLSSFNLLTGKQEVFALSDAKAVFFVKHLIGDSERADKQGFVQMAGGENMFVEFNDNECMWGVCENYNPNALGFFIKPCDPDCNNLLVYVDRRATRYVLTG